MEKIDRYKQLIRHLVRMGLASSQKEVGVLLGYTNESTFSQLINGKVATPKKFHQKFKDLEPKLNIEWLETGEGNMLLNEVSGNNNTSIAGNSNQINCSSTLEKALDEISEMRKLFQVQVNNNHEQFDRLVSVIENLTKNNK